MAELTDTMLSRFNEARTELAREHFELDALEEFQGLMIIPWSAAESLNGLAFATAIVARRG